MRNIFRILLLLVLSTGSQYSKAQALKYFQGNTAKVLNTFNDTLAFGFTGGFIAPQFNTMDLDGDGYKDLVIFERATNKFSTYLKTKPGTFQFEYAPAYAAALPQCFFWVVMRDYNCDGKEDIFTNGSQIGNLRVYKNTSSGTDISFELVTDLLTDSSGINISFDAIDYPSIVDIDGDGDLDILHIQSIFGMVSYYQNKRVEANLHCDSLRYDIVDWCWGSFMEGGLTRDLFLGADCFFPRKGSELNRHAGSTLMHLDMDEDGDLEALISDVGYRDFYITKNGRVETKWIRDTIVSYDSLFPVSKPVNIRSFPVAFFTDFDDDGIKDLAVAPNDQRDGQKIKQMWLYKNHGKNNKPDFRFVQDDFIQQNTIDLGGTTAPVLYDWNGDGLMDLLLAYKDPGLTDIPMYDRLALFINRGTPSIPAFKLQNSNLLNLAKDSLLGLKPSFGDLNGDGKPDLLLGNFRGTMFYYQNNGTAGDTSFTLVTKEFQDLYPGNASAPQIIDLNRDGLNDLVIGTAEGIVKFYANKGTKTNPAFNQTPDIDSLGKILVNEFYWYYLTFDSLNNPIDSELVYFPEGFAAPHVADLDGDGKYDLAVGAKTGKTFIYLDIEKDLEGKFAETTDYFFQEFNKKWQTFAPGGLANPFAGMLDGDSMPDLLIGNICGGIFHLSSQKGPSTYLFERENTSMSLRVYPNPANSHVTLARDIYMHNGEAAVSVYDLTGKLHLQTNFPEGTAEMNISVDHLAAGIYIIRYAGQEFLGNTKVIIQGGRP